MVNGRHPQPDDKKNWQACGNMPGGFQDGDQPLAIELGRLRLPVGFRPRPRLRFSHRGFDTADLKEPKALLDELG